MHAYYTTILVAAQTAFAVFNVFSTLRDYDWDNQRVAGAY